VSELVGSIFMGIADIVTDGIACARLLHGDVAVVNEGYRAAYLTILCFGTVCTAVSLAYRLRNAHLMRAHVRELSQVRRTGSASAARRQAQQHEWELEQTNRTKAILSLGLLSIAAQGADARCGPIHRLNLTRLPLQVYRCPSQTAV
jgi:hypothetical protein